MSAQVVSKGQPDVLKGTPVLTRLFGDIEELGDSRFRGMLGCGLIGVLDTSERQMVVANGEGTTPIFV
jgi:hypothetical protein